MTAAQGSLNSGKDGEGGDAGNEENADKPGCEMGEDTCKLRRCVCPAGKQYPQIGQRLGHGIRPEQGETNQHDEQGVDSGDKPGDRMPGRFPDGDDADAFHGEKQAVEQAPYQKGEIGAVPQPRSGEDDHLIEEHPSFAPAVAAQGDIQVFLEPGGEGDMPAAPEILDTPCLLYTSGSCYNFAALTYLLFQRAGYDVYYVTGLGWQHGTYHCWILANFDGGWYYVDSLYVRSAKLTADELTKKGYKWDQNAFPS